MGHALPLCCAGLLLASLSGCAVGNQYDYRLQALPFPVTGTASVGVAVNDARTYVLSGDKEPNFVGLQRGGFDNRFDVTTASGKPLAADMKESIGRGLTGRGYKVVAVDVKASDHQAIVTTATNHGLTRVVTLDLKQWKSDTMANSGIQYDRTLRVFDAAGTLLGEATAARNEPVGASAMVPSNNSAAIARTFERIVGGLFNAPEIRKALDGT